MASSSRLLLVSRRKHPVIPASFAPDYGHVPRAEAPPWQGSCRWSGVSSGAGASLWLSSADEPSGSRAASGACLTAASPVRRIGSSEDEPIRQTGDAAVRQAPTTRSHDARRAMWMPKHSLKDTAWTTAQPEGCTHAAMIYAEAQGWMGDFRSRMARTQRCGFSWMSTALWLASSRSGFPSLARWILCPLSRPATLLGLRLFSTRLDVLSFLIRFSVRLIGTRWLLVRGSSRCSPGVLGGAVLESRRSA